MSKKIKYIVYGVLCCLVSLILLVYTDSIYKKGNIGNSEASIEDGYIGSTHNSSSRYIVFDSVWENVGNGEYRQRYDDYDIVNGDTIFLFSSYIYRYHYEEMEE